MIIFPMIPTTNVAEGVQQLLPYMTEISVGFTIATPGSLDPGMHFDLEVKWLKAFSTLAPSQNTFII